MTSPPEHKFVRACALADVPDDGVLGVEVDAAQDFALGAVRLLDVHMQVADLKGRHICVLQRCCLSSGFFYKKVQLRATYTSPSSVLTG